MNSPSRAVVSGYGMTLLGVVTMVQCSGVVESYVLLGVEDVKNVIVSGGMVVLGGCLAALGLALASRPAEIHRGTEQAPHWMRDAATVETVGLLGSFPVVDPTERSENGI